MSSTIEPIELEMFLRSVGDLYNRETVQNYLQILINRGFRLRVFQEEALYQQAVPEVSSLAQQVIDVYLEQHQDKLGLIAYYLGDLDLEIWFDIEPQRGVISFMVEQEDFYGSEEGQAAYMELLEVLKETYRYWHPFYGYEIFHGGIQPERAAVLTAHEIHHLYFINFLGPEIVEKLGQKQLLVVPAWQSELLDDGGILLIPVDLTGDEMAHSLKQVATILGLQTPQAPNEAWIEDQFADPTL